MVNKKDINDLAIFGKAPAFDKKMHVGCPNIGNRKDLLKRINDILDTKWLTNNGPYVQELEKRIARFTGARHCIATCNGTVALEIAIRALGLTGEVILPSMTFVATAHALQWQEITPVFCDVSPGTYTIDPRQAKELITSKTTGILGVHVWGRVCDIEELSEMAKGHKIKLLFDAAHAFGCSYNGNMIGSFGDAEVFSFHATKFVNTLEGGAIVTNNDELSQKIRLMKNFGFSGYDNVIYLGTNGKMNELSAAMGLTSMEGMDGFISKNLENYRLYQKELADTPGIKLIDYNEKERCNYQYIVAEADKERTGISRDDIVDILWAENILARRYFYPGCHRMEPYCSQERNAGLKLNITEHLLDRVMQLPTGISVGRDEIRRICQVIKLVTLHGDEISNRLNLRKYEKRS